MRSDLILTGAIPGLLRRGSPTDRGTVVALDRGKASVVALVDFMELTVNGVWIVPCAALTLDLTDPTGRFHALLWLRERGHDLRWAEDEPEVLAWSVLNVAGGGATAIRGLLLPWTNPRWSADVWGRQYSNDRDAPFLVMVHDVDEYGDEWTGWVMQPRSGIWSRFDVPHGPETGVAGRAAADRAALAAGYALRNDDGTLTLPELREAPRG